MPSEADGAGKEGCAAETIRRLAFRACEGAVRPVYSVEM